MPILFAVVVALSAAAVASAACTHSCASGDPMSGTTCTDTSFTYAATPVYSCDSGWSKTGSKCRKDLCGGADKLNAHIGSAYVGLPGSCASGDTCCADQNTCCQVGTTNAGQCCTGGDANACRDAGDCCYCYWDAYNGQGHSPTWTGSVWRCSTGKYVTVPADSGSSEFRYCYFNRAAVNCPGKFVTNGGTCEIDADVSYTCPNGGTLQGTSCILRYAASLITTSAQCNVVPSGNGCDWCDGIGLCLPTGSTCYATCLAATANPAYCSNSQKCNMCAAPTSIGVCQPNAGVCYTSCLDATIESAVCDGSTSCKWCAATGICFANSAACYGSCLASTVSPTHCDISANCKWCPVGASIGVCQPNAGVCYDSCLLATAESAVCDGSNACQWCGVIGVCQPKPSGVCYTTCLAASAEPAVCGGSQQCEWCDTLPYCRRKADTCHTRCTTIAPDDPAICQVASIQSACQWCAALQYCVAVGDAAALRCASRCETMIWRRDVCDGALSCHWCPQHGGRCKPIFGKSQGYLNWRGEIECDTGSASLSVSEVPSTSTSVSVTASVSHITLSVEATESTTSTQTTSLSATLTWTASTTTSTTVSTSHSASRTLSSSSSLSISVSSTASSSHTATLQTASATSESLTPSFRLPPCNATHAAVLAYIWPLFFNFTTTYSAVRSAGFPGVDVTGDLNPALIYQVPLLLRQEELDGGHPMLATPNPYEPPNDLGFVHRSQLPVKLNWLNRSTIRVGLSAIPDYWLDTSEEITIDVPFEQIVYCNRTDPVSVWVPPTIQLIGVHIMGPEVNDAVTNAAQALTSLFALSSILSSDPSSAVSLQTLAVIGMTTCGQPTSKQTLSNYRVLGPLPVGIDGFLGVVVGNAVLVAGAGVLQASVVYAIAKVRHVPTRDVMSWTRFPSITITVVFALFQGTFYAASQLMSLPDSSIVERLVGSVVFAACLSGPPVVIWWCRTKLTRQCVRYEYQRSTAFLQRYAGRLVSVLLPRGRIEPPQVRQQYSVLVSGFIVNRAELPVLVLLVPYTLTLLALWHPVDSLMCSLFLSLALVIHVVVAAWVAYWRPHRFHHESPTFALGVLLNGVLLMMCVVALSHPRTLSRTSATIIALAQLVLQLTRTCLSLVGTLLEKQLAYVPTATWWVVGVSAGVTLGDHTLLSIEGLTEVDALNGLLMNSEDEETELELLKLLDGEKPQQCPAEGALAADVASSHDDEEMSFLAGLIDEPEEDVAVDLQHSARIVDGLLVERRPGAVDDLSLALFDIQNESNADLSDDSAMKASLITETTRAVELTVMVAPLMPLDENIHTDSCQKKMEDLSADDMSRETHDPAEVVVGCNTTTQLDTQIGKDEPEQQ